MKKALTVVYGALSYALFLGVFLYLVGFLADVFVPRTVDAGPESPLGTALLIDGLLLGLFGLQHSGMARKGFKRRWTRVVPEPIERSTYVLITNLVFLLLFWQWRPIPASVWEVSQPLAAGALWMAYGFGWALILAASFAVDHFDLFGLKQVVQFAREREARSPEFTARLFYRFVRHPLYVGWLIVFWATPSLSVGHLVFSLGMSAYILIAIQLEERDLVREHGRAYLEYKQRVPMLVPRAGRRAAGATPVPAGAGQPTSLG